VRVEVLLQVAAAFEALLADLQSQRNNIQRSFARKRAQSDLGLNYSECSLTRGRVMYTATARGRPLPAAPIMNIDHKGNHTRQICARLKKLMGEKLMEKLPVVRCSAVLCS
jgi:hypothetical protein